MKTIALICGALLLQGVNSFAETNTPSATRNVPSKPVATASQAKPAPANGKQTTVATKPQADTMTDQIRVYRRASREGLLVPRKPSRDYYVMTEGMFRPAVPGIGDTVVRDTVVTIFPTGK